jgi:hypothetical protein
MSRSNESIRKNIREAHGDISDATYKLCQIASGVSYLHPKLAGELECIQLTIDEARKTLKDSEMDLLNNEINESKDFNSRILFGMIKSQV